MMILEMYYESFAGYPNFVIKIFIPINLYIYNKIINLEEYKERTIDVTSI